VSTLISEMEISVPSNLAEERERRNAHGATFPQRAGFA
jgi:hypothetical protein